MKLEEIAKRANVSKSAVSLALNGKPGVSAETRDRILKIARELGYTPKSIQRTEEVYGAPKVIRFVARTNFGIISEEYQNQPFFTELFHDIEEQCRYHGYALLYSSIRHDTFLKTIQQVEQDYTTKGIILLGTNVGPEEIDMVAQQNPNIVIIDTLFETLHHNFVVMNNVMGAHQAARHLIELGHQSIGYVQSKSRMYNFDARRRGFFESIQSYGVVIPQDSIFTMEPTVTTSSPDFMTQWSNLRGQRPTALFCECDYMAISVIKSFTAMGIRVPQDVSVIGFDNIRESNIILPELTTVNVAKQEIAANAVRSLVASMESAQTERTKIIVDTTLVQRNSCSTPSLL